MNTQEQELTKLNYNKQEATAGTRYATKQEINKHNYYRRADTSARKKGHKSATVQVLMHKA